MKVLLVSLLTLVVLSARAQDTTDYAARWQEVYHLEVKDQPRSAQKVVENIYARAGQENQLLQQIRSLLYLSKFRSILEEEAEVGVMEDFRQALSSSSGIQRAVLASLTASLYQEYLRQNTWKIQRRTEVSGEQRDADFRTWTSGQFRTVIDSLYHLSLSDTLLLQQTSLDEVEEILYNRAGQRHLRPSLYDLLAHRVIDWYASFRVSRSFELSREMLFNPDYRKDSMEYNLVRLLDLYASLIRLRQADTAAVVNLWTERTNLLSEDAPEYGVYDLRESLYDSLLALYSGHPSGTLLQFELANDLYEQGQQYSPDQAELRYAWREAKQLAEKAIAAYPESFGASKCRVLIQYITRPNMEAEMESFLPVRRPSPVLIRYRNTDTLRLSVRKLTAHSLRQSDGNESDRIRAGREVTSYSLALPAADDYREHTTEVALPPLPAGTYGLIITSNASDHKAFNIFQVTDLALDVVQSGRNIRLRALDRLTGLPLEQAQITVSFPKSKRRPVRLTGEGIVEVENGQYDAMATLEGDTTLLELHQYFYFQNDQPDVSEARTARIVAFTDRSIYRPGQTLYFKAILVEQHKGESSVVPGEYMNIYMEDPNGEEFVNLRLKTNKYGSVSGEIMLPADRITGEYWLYADEDYEEDSKFYEEQLDDLIEAEISIRVEEYKRPTFEVTFDPVTAAYAIGDSITVSGQAMSFSGAPLSHTRVDVKVEKGGYPRETILAKEIRTDADGRFSLTFRSTPDSRPRRNFYVQQYHVTADVHDITGEVRSAQTYVRAARHAVEVTATIPGEITEGDTLNVVINSENINDSPALSAGILEVVRLKAPDRTFRPRKWGSPDMPLYDEETYRSLFPDRAYGNETNKATWPRMEVAASFPFRAEGDEVLTLTDELPAGHYLIRVLVDSVYRAAPPEDTYIWVKSPDKAIPDHKVFSMYFPTSGEDAITVEMASGVDSLFVSVDLVSGDEIIASKELLLNKGRHLVSFEEVSADGPLTIQFSYVWRNDYESGSRPVPRSQSPRDLRFEALTFRDKIDPGAEEEWRFRLTGPDGKGASAEVLASMYDASLDKFREHAWNKPTRNQHEYYDGYFSMLSRNFQAQRLWQWRNYEVYIPIPTRYYDELNRFGFSLSRPADFNNAYITRLKNIMALVDTVSEVSRGFNPDTQPGYVSGKVVNKENEPLTGVNVVVRGTARGTITDIQGNYSIKAAPGEELVFSFVGFATQRVLPGQSNSIDLVMAEDIQHLSEVVITGYGVEEKKELTGSVSSVSFINEETLMEEIEVDLDVKVQGSVAGVRVRGVSSLSALADAGVLVVVDGVITQADSALPEDIGNIQVLKDAAATALYGARAANGVVIITTKEGQKRLDEQLARVKSRGDLRETAFFLPHLTTNRKGEVTFSFTSPENLTRWKLQLLAHDKSFQWGLKTMQAITRKELMVIPHLPRFLREDDEITITAKVVNLSGEPKTGTAMVGFKDALTGASLDSVLLLSENGVPFSVGPNAQTSLSWKLVIPDGLTAVEVEVKAATETQGDGERHVLPVLPNRTLVTESIPLYSKQGQENTFVLPGLRNNSSATLAHQSLRLSVETNPVWTALQSLPYLMEFPYECSEQTFARLYANRIGSFLLTHDPALAGQLNTWRENAPAASPLEKNQEVIGMMLRETPWWRDARSESEAEARLARLMQKDSLEAATTALMEKLMGMQNNDGGMPWFAGGRSNQFITQHIASSFLRLIAITGDDQLAATGNEFLKQMKRYLDNELKDDYENERQLRHVHYQYFYLSGLMQSADTLPADQAAAYEYYYEKLKNHWQAENLMLKSLAAISFQLHGDTALANEVLTSIREYSLRDEEMGMYWKAPDRSWYWHQAPIESHVMAMHAFDLILPDSLEEKQELLEDQKIWLLRQKQTQHWPSTKATTEAVYAMLSFGADWVSEDPQITVKTGAGQVLEPSPAGEYVKTWTAREIRPELAGVEIRQEGAGASWGLLRWQYFEEYDHIRQNGESLQVEKQVYRVVQTGDGEQLERTGGEEVLNNGDLVRIRLILRTDRTLEFIHLKDQRAAGFEPVDVLSGYAYQEGLRYYQSTRDAATHFFFDHADQGVYVFEYDLRATHEGSYASGIAQMENMYSPAFDANSQSIRITIE